MSWDLASFQIVGDAIKKAPRTDNGEVQLSPLVFGLLQVGFYANFIVSIRRVTDHRGDVASLVRLLKEMGKKSSCITREGILKAEGMPYDFLPAKQKEAEFLSKAENGEVACVPREMDGELFADRHARIDRLAHVTERTRSPGDHVPRRLFLNLLKKIQGASRTAVTYANQYVAHAEPRDSSWRVDSGEINLTHEKLTECHIVLCQVFNFLRSEILGEGRGPLLAIPPANHFSYLDQPLAKPEDISRFRAKWDQMINESLKAGEWGMDDYEIEYRSTAQA